MLKSTQPRSTPDEFDPFGALSGAGGGAVLWARQGTVCAQRGDFVGALQCFQRSLETDLDCAEAWAGLSEVFTRMHDRRRAESCLEVSRRLRGRFARLAIA